jgi:hypothetical protein
MMETMNNLINFLLILVGMIAALCGISFMIMGLIEIWKYIIKQIREIMKNENRSNRT